jgi:hypothetical protein
VGNGKIVDGDEFFVLVDVFKNVPLAISLKRIIGHNGNRSFGRNDEKENTGEFYGF